MKNDCPICEKVLADFEHHGKTASYHYADDTTSEWGVARRAECRALALFDGNVMLQDEMREIAKGFLWSLNSKRPTK